MEWVMLIDRTRQSKVHCQCSGNLKTNKKMKRVIVCVISVKFSTHLVPVSTAHLLYKNTISLSTEGCCEMCSSSTSFLFQLCLTLCMRLCHYCSVIALPLATAHVSSSTRENNGALHCVPVGEHECVRMCACANSVSLSVSDIHIHWRWGQGASKENQ